jgi:hypothetical protein
LCRLQQTELVHSVQEIIQQTVFLFTKPDFRSPTRAPCLISGSSKG